MFFIKVLVLNSAGPPVSPGKRIASFRISQVCARRTTIKVVSLIITALLEYGTCKSLLLKGVVPITLPPKIQLKNYEWKGQRRKG